MGLLSQSVTRLVARPLAGAVVLVLLLLAAAPGLLRLDPHHDVIGAFAESVGLPVPDAASQLVVAAELSTPGAVSELRGAQTALRHVPGVTEVDVPRDPAPWLADAPESLHDDIVKTVMGSVDSHWAPIRVQLDTDAPEDTVALLREQLGATLTLDWAMAGPPVTRVAQSEVVQGEQVRLLALTTGVLALCLWGLSGGCGALCCR